MTLAARVQLIGVLAVGLASASPSTAAAAGANVAHFGMFALAPREKARLRVVNVSSGAVCVVDLGFFNEAATSVAAKQEALAPGQSTVLTVQVGGRRAVLRASVVDLQNSEALDSICIATLQVFDGDGGTTALVVRP